MANLMTKLHMGATFAGNLQTVLNQSYAALRYPPARNGEIYLRVAKGAQNAIQSLDQIGCRIR